MRDNYEKTYLNEKEALFNNSKLLEKQNYEKELEESQYENKVKSKNMEGEEKIKQYEDQIKNLNFEFDKIINEFNNEKENLYNKLSHQDSEIELINNQICRDKNEFEHIIKK
jgi:SMC interacting uncharacterized protein involved in chromosome segregation